MSSPTASRTAAQITTSASGSPCGCSLCAVQPISLKRSASSTYSSGVAWKAVLE